MIAEHKTGDTEAANYTRSLACFYNEIDTYVGYDIETEVYYDIFGKTLTEAEVDSRRELEAKRRADIIAEKQWVLEEKQRRAEEEFQRAQSELTYLRKELV